MLGLLLLAVSAAVLWWGAELFVGHAATAGRRLGTTGLAVGLLLAGAEPEELITSVIAALRGQGGIAAGDAIGANVTMLTLVLGLAALARPLPAGGRVRRYLIGAGLLGSVAALVVPGGVGRVEGAALVVLYVAAVAAVWWVERRVPAIGELAEIEDIDALGAEGSRALLLAFVGLAVMAAGGWVAVLGAERVVQTLGVQESVVGLSLVALATTAELFALAVAAVRRDVGELAVAGVVGSAGYNATITLGGAAIVRPLDTAGILPAAWLAAGLPVLILALGGRTGQIGKAAAAGLVFIYLAYLTALYR
ncbi:MAG: sodium:calcium antiporter [Candidatus Limnocylindria bacterium]